MRLFKDGEFITVPTNCKTKRCKACNLRVKALVKKRIRSGCSLVGPSWFITLTYRQVDESTQRNALSVAADWTALVRLRKKSHRSLTWFKVVEMTKRGQPHLHLIVGGIGNDRTGCCYPRARDGRCSHEFSVEWVESECRSDDVCVEHEWVRDWFDITDDSFVVYAKPVKSSRRAASYLAKYVVKDVASSGLARLGFKKTWTRSRNWPGCDKLEFANEDWDKTEFTYSAGSTEVRDKSRKEVENSAQHPLSQKTGSSEAWTEAQKALDKVNLMKLKGMADAINRTQNVSSGRSGGVRRGGEQLPSSAGRETK